MTYEEAIGVIFGAMVLTVFAAWYLWCIYEMFIVAPNLRSYFSYTYENSGRFVIVNIVMFILGSAWVLMKVTGG